MHDNILKVACIQLCAGQNIAQNLELVELHIRAAAKAGAKFILTPEQTVLMELAGDALFDNIYLQDECASLKHLQKLAKSLEIYLCIGSLAIKNSDGSVANRGFLIDPNGDIISQYDKIHMFDIKLKNGDEYKESATYKPGNQLGFVKTELFNFGHTICYDLRFPKLYNALAKLGAEIIVVPAAFTVQTGQAHWHILLRARAIETGSFILAAAQGGSHQNGRKTYGHSIIISPWGDVLAEMQDEGDIIPTGYIMAEIDLAEVAKNRKNIPVLEHERAFN
ncbi:MAG: carbon-nitrogen hydrolase family protein [Rhizobiales bacterium]|nr:carbon-nitrogen hydrolase family protein [Hyphomicrobiales bacterium]